MKYKAVIFDLDGVVCSTDRYHYLAWKTIADELGIEFNETINNRLRGVGRMESLEIILQGYDGNMSAADRLFWADKKNNLYVRYLQKVSPADIVHGFMTTLAYLKQKGIKTAIGSSSKNACAILARIGLEHDFDAIVDGNAIHHPKPDPEVFLKASELLGITPPSCLVIEDGESGIKAALAANMDCAAMGDGINCGIAQYNLHQITDLLTIMDFE